MKNQLAKFIVETLSKMKKFKFDDNEFKKIDDLIEIIMNLNDQNKYDKLKFAHEELSKKSNEMMDEFPNNIDEIIINSKY